MAIVKVRCLTIGSRPLLLCRGTSEKQDVIPRVRDHSNYAHMFTHVSTPTYLLLLPFLSPLPLHGSANIFTTVQIRSFHETYLLKRISGFGRIFSDCWYLLYWSFWMYFQKHLLTFSLRAIRFVLVLTEFESLIKIIKIKLSRI